MITKVKVTAGFAKDLPCIKDKTFQFSPDKPNVIFGPNGVGKTVLLKILAGHTLAPQHGGWSTTRHPPQFREKFNCKRISIDCSAKIEWDGSPTFFHRTDFSDKAPISFDSETDGILSTHETVSFLFAQPSSGQVRIIKLNRIPEMIKNPPNLFNEKPNNYNDTWIEAFKQQEDYVTSFIKENSNQRVTLLLDEPEKGLDIPKQYMFWKHWVPNVNKLCQVIITSHCIFAIKNEDMNIIDIEQGYIDACKQHI